jgi:hypothetical protein
LRMTTSVMSAKALPETSRASVQNSFQTSIESLPFR